MSIDPDNVRAAIERWEKDRDRRERGEEPGRYGQDRGRPLADWEFLAGAILRRQRDAAELRADQMALRRPGRKPLTPEQVQARSVREARKSLRKRGYGYLLEGSGR